MNLHNKEGGVANKATLRHLYQVGHLGVFPSCPFAAPQHSLA